MKQLIAALCLVVPLAANAQFYDGQKFERNDKSRKVMDTFGRCIAKGETDLARQFVLGAPSAAEALNKSRYMSGYCLPTNISLRFSLDAVRGPAAEYLIGRDFGGVRPLQLQGLSMHDASRTAATASANSEGTKVMVIEYHSFLAGLGECVIRADQPAALRVISSKVASDEEKAAIQATVPAIQPCLPQGVQTSLDPTAIRTAITVAYYRLAYAARQAVPAAAAVERG